MRHSLQQPRLPMAFDINESFSLGDSYFSNNQATPCINDFCLTSHAYSILVASDVQHDLASLDF